MGNRTWHPTDAGLIPSYGRFNHLIVDVVVSTQWAVHSIRRFPVFMSASDAYETFEPLNPPIPSDCQ